jgi:transcriptional regulator of arginine metabolism
MKEDAKIISLLQQLLRSESSAGTQEEIGKDLAKHGILLNQVKISRLLHKLGAIKMIENKRTVYRLPTELVPITPEHTLKNIILSIRQNETLIVVQTTPGSAQFVARFLDQSRDSRILGTVAGDDTIFIAPTSHKVIKSLAQRLTQILLGV